MPMVPFLSGSYEHRSRDVSVRKCFNFYPELTGQQGKTEIVLIGTPGTETFSDLSAEFSTPDVGCRGLYYTSSGRLFAAYGGKIFEINSDGSYTYRFAVGPLASKISFADNGKYLVLADGNLFYYYNLDTNALASYTIEDDGLGTPAFSNPTVVKFLGDRFYCITKDSNKFWWSNLGIEGSREWEALSFDQPKSGADPILSMEVRQGELWMFGPRSYEVFATSTNPDAPVAKRGGSINEIGVGAPYSTAVIADQIFWLGSSRAGQNQVFVTEGYSAKRISDHAIEKILGDVDLTSSDAVGFTYQQEGHIFYVLTLISGNRTLVYDLVTGMWHERGTRRPLVNIQDRWAPLYAAYAYSRVYVGSTLGPQVLRLDLGRYKEWDDRAIVSLFQSPVYWEDLRLLQHKEFTVDLETGVGLQIGQGSDPQIMMQYSDDGGHTWSSELWTTIGKIGQYKTVASWRRLGMSRERVYRVSISDPVKRVLIGARLDAVPGRLR